MLKTLIFIVNPVAGRKTIQKAIPASVRIFMDAGYLVTTMVTSQKGEAAAFAHRYGADHDLVVAAGGDGTLNEVTSGMLRGNLRIPLGYIPCGSTIGVPHEDDYVFGAVSNMRSAAGILQYPADLVTLDDGAFEVLLIRMPRNLPGWQQLLHGIRTNDYKNCPLIELTQAQNIWVDNPDGLIWSLDGERATEQNTMAITVQQKRLKLKG